MLEHVRNGQERMHSADREKKNLGLDNRAMALTYIADDARFETATETLAEYIGYLNSEIMAEEAGPEPNFRRITALENELELLVDQRKAITPDSQAIIDRAIYIYAPILKRMHEAD